MGWKPRKSGYLLDDSSPRPGQVDGQVSAGMLRKRLPTARLVWLTNAVLTRRRHPWVEWLKRGLLRLSSAALLPSNEHGRQLMVAVMIGIDPHKRSNTALVLDGRETVLARRRFANDSAGYRDLKAGPGVTR